MGRIEKLLDESYPSCLSNLRLCKNHALRPTPQDGIICTAFPDSDFDYFLDLGKKKKKRKIKKTTNLSTLKRAVCIEEALGNGI